MTYRILLDKLLKECVQKGRSYETAMGSNGQAMTYIAAVRKEWQLAEDAYESILERVMSGEVRLEDLVPAPQTTISKPRIELPSFPAFCYN